jgi:hypothetical protein
MNHLPYNHTLRATIHSPASKKINHPTRHNSRKTEAAKDGIPKNASGITMEKKMIYKLPILFAHTTSINHNDPPLFEIVHCKDLP